MLAIAVLATLAVPRAEQCVQLQQKQNQLQQEQTQLQQEQARAECATRQPQQGTPQHALPQQFEPGMGAERSSPLRKEGAPNRAPERARAPLREPKDQLLASARGEGAHGAESAPSVAVLPAVCVAPWRDAEAVAVDNTDATARDTPECGASGEPPCKTIRYGVSRALPGATITVQGGGEPYLGECGARGPAPAPTPAPPMPAPPTPAPSPFFSGSSGIRIDGRSLTVEGVGNVIIDCENHGRAFRFNASNTTTGAEPGAGPTLRLAGLEVRNGAAPPTASGEDGSGGAVWAGGGGTLELESVAFVDCAAPARGGGAYAQDVRIHMDGSHFVRTVAVSDGGGMYLRFDAPVSAINSVTLRDSNFDNCAPGFAYFFMEALAEYVWYDSCANAVPSGGSFPGLPPDLDAAVPHNNDGKSVYFFKGSQYWKFDLLALAVEDGYPKVYGNTSLFPGVPHDLDAAVSHQSDGRHVYFFKGDQYWRFDLDAGTMDSGYPSPLQAGWGVPPNVGAVIPNWSGGRGYYFFRDDQVWINPDGGYSSYAEPYGNGTGLFEGVPIGISAAFSRCGAAGPPQFGASCEAAKSSGGSGGGVFIGYYGDVQGGSTTIEHNVCRGTRADAFYGGGVNLEFFSSVTNTTVVVRDSIFSDTLSSFGSGLYIGYNNDLQGGSTVIENSSFAETRATGGGGAIYLWFGGDVANVSTAVRSTNFSYTSSGSAGGGLQIAVAGVAQGGSTAVERCGFAGTSAASTGGGVTLQYRNSATDVTTTIECCDFEGTSATSYGGGAYLQFSGTTTNATTAVRDTNFVKTSGSYGGGLYIGYDAVEGGTAAIKGCGFAGTRATINGGGAYLSFFGVVSNATVTMRDTSFRNTVSGCDACTGMYINYRYLVQGGTTAIESCDFAGMRATGYGDGLEVYFGGGAINATTNVRGTNFVNTSGATSGLAIVYSGYSDTVLQGGTTTIEGCAFEGTRTSASFTLSVYFGIPAHGAAVTLQRTTFTDTSGSGANIAFSAGATRVATLVNGCAFVRTSGNSNSCSLNIGYGSRGGRSITSADIRTAIVGSTFCDTSEGGACVTFSAMSSRTATNVSNTTFTGIDGSSALNLQHLGPTTGDAALLVDGAAFAGCTGIDSALAVQVLGEADGVTLSVLRSVFANNVARGAGGGGALSFKLPQDAPANLRFVGNPDDSDWRNMSSGADQSRAADDDDRFNPFYPYEPLPPDREHDPCSGCGTYPNGCVTCPQFKPYNLATGPVYPLENVYREWTAANTFIVSDCNFVANRAMYKGGAIAVPAGGSGSLERCVVEGNAAETLFGGGVAVGGTVKLAIRNSTLRRNSCAQSGCQLYSSSGASITFDNNSHVDLTACVDGACSDGFAAAQAGNMTWGGGSAMSCEAGYVLLNSSALGYVAPVPSWKLEAPPVYPPSCKLSAPDVAAATEDGVGNTPFDSDCNLVANNTNCPCYFSDNPYGGAYSGGFGTGAVFPSMLVSTLSYGCRACPTGRVNPTSPVLGAANLDDANATIGTCSICPAGKFQGLTGQASCDACAPGQSQSEAGFKSCVPCADGFFQLESGATSCAPCPKGASCPSGGLVPKASEYGMRTSDGAYVFTRCPVGYCVESNDGDGDFAPNATYAQCANASHRDWTVPLCGGCRPGYSQSISTTNCIADGTCAATALWFWPASLLYCLVYAAYFLWSSTPVGSDAAGGGSRHEDASTASEAECSSDAREGRSAQLVDNSRGLRLTLVEPEDECEGGGAAQDGNPGCVSRVRGSRVAAALAAGSIKVIAFFFQMAGLVVPLKGLTAHMGDTLRSFFGMQVSSEASGTSSTGAGYCVWAGMSSLTKIELFYAVPAAMGVVLWLVARFGDAGARAKARCAGADASEQPTLGARLPGAFAELMQIAYATLSKTTLQLLNCVSLPDSSERVLFLAGATECGVWQAPLYALLAMLVLLPATPLLVLGARQLPPRARLAKAAWAMRFPAHPMAQALRSSLTKAFTPENWHWPALLALQRFAMVATPIFVTDSIQSSLVLTFIAFVMAWKQARASPYENDDVNAHAKLAAVCLVALAVLNLPQRVLSQASVDLASPSQRLLKKVCDGIEVAMIFFLLAPALAPLLAPVLAHWLRAATARAESSIFGERSGALSWGHGGGDATDLATPLVPGGGRTRGVVV
jgi:hypothetical protein